VTDREVAAGETVLVFDEIFRPVDKIAPRRARVQHSREIGLAEQVAIKGLRVAGNPAVTLRDRPFGIHGDELVRTVFLPDAGEPRRCTGKMMDQRIKRTERDARRVAPLHPDVEKAGQKLREFVVVEVKAALNFAGRAAGKGRIDLEIVEPEIVREIAIKALGPGVETSLVEHRNNAHFDPSRARLLQPSGPEFGVGFGAALEEPSMDVGVVHRRAERAAKHRAQHVVPSRRIADEIRLQIMREMAPTCGGGAVHERASFDEPCRSHNHRLAALPVDFAFLDRFVFEVIEQAARQQWNEDGREAMRFLVLEAVVARDVALRGRQEDHAKYFASHGLSSPIKSGCSSILARSCFISSAAASMRENSRFTPAQE